MYKKILTTLIALSLVMFLVSCTGSNDQGYEETESKMDTVVTLKAYGPNAQTAVKESYKRIDEIEQMASSSIATSDVSKINDAAGREYVKVHPEIIKMIKTSIQYSKLCGGAFDITVGPLINLWGIGTPEERVPSDEEIKAKLSLVGYENISINEDDSSVMLTKPGMSIDLGGIAKGFTADEVQKIFNQYSIKDGLINLGGSSIYAMGNNSKGAAWSVGLQHPRQAQNQGFIGIVNVSNKSVSTSGDYERYFIKNGVRYHHILDPFTGYPANSGVISDTIIIDSSVPDHSMLADLLTKIVFVLGPEKGMKILETLPDVECMAATSDYKVYTTPGMKDKIQNLSSDFKFAN